MTLVYRNHVRGRFVRIDSEHITQFEDYLPKEQVSLKNCSIEEKKMLWNRLFAFEKNTKVKINTELALGMKSDLNTFLRDVIAFRKGNVVLDFSHSEHPGNQSAEREDSTQQEVVDANSRATNAK